MGFLFDERRCHRPSLWLSFGASGTFGCCGLLFKRSFWNLPDRFSSALLNGFLSLWNQLADVLGKKAGIYLTIYQIKESGNANGELAVLIFLGIVCGLLGFLILKLRLYVLLLLLQQYFRWF
ncbi:MAG: hypothetical protein ACLTZM_18230 [Ruminococcus sp.]